MVNDRLGGGWVWDARGFKITLILGTVRYFDVRTLGEEPPKNIFSWSCI